MYLRYFGMRELPFSLTPDTSFFLNSNSHREALNVLMVALRSREGITKVVGEVGTGKTLLCRKLLRLLQDQAATAYIPNPMLTPIGLYRTVAEEFGVEFPRNLDPHELLTRINQRLIEFTIDERPAVLLVDEAQALPRATLEALRLLTNLETENRKLLQVVILGQPELDVRLSRPNLRQLRERIVFSHRIKPLDRKALGRYVAHRMNVAGAERCIFNSHSLDSIYRSSRGIPRLVNILCHKSLLAAYGRGDASVGWRHARRAAADTEGVQRLAALRQPRRWITWWSLLGIALGIGSNAVTGLVA